MPSGGHARSGPAKVEGSRTSERQGFTLTALPPGGYDGDVPDLLDFMPDATDRHSSIWSQLWATPQACAWSVEPWRWPTVADLVMWMVRAQDPDAAATIGSTVRQYRDDCGLSKAGLAHNGWKIAEPAKVEESNGPAPTDGVVTDMQTWLAGGA